MVIGVFTPRYVEVERTVDFILKLTIEDFAKINNILHTLD